MIINFNVEHIVGKVEDATMEGIRKATRVVAEEAVNLILSPPKTGRIYTRPGGRKHQASAPGEAPANDTGRLAMSMRMEFDREFLFGAVIFPTPYAPFLEYGTNRMAPRPFARRALREKSEEIKEAISSEIGNVL